MSSFTITFISREVSWPSPALYPHHERMMMSFFIAEEERVLKPLVTLTIYARKILNQASFPVLHHTYSRLQYEQRGEGLAGENCTPLT